MHIAGAHAKPDSQQTPAVAGSHWNHLNVCVEGKRFEHESLHSQQYTEFTVTDEDTGGTQAHTLLIRAHT